MFRIKLKTIGYILAYLVLSGITALVFITKGYNSEDEAIRVLSTLALIVIAGVFTTVTAQVIHEFIKSSESIIILPTIEQKVRVLTGKNLRETSPIEIELNNLEIDKLMDKCPIYDSLPEGDYVESELD